MSAPPPWGAIALPVLLAACGRSPAPPSGGTVGLDVTPPAISGVAFDPTAPQIVGLVEDPGGVARVEVFDGPARVAGTRMTAVDGPGDAPRMAYAEEAGAFRIPLSLPPGAYELTIVAEDESGNEASVPLDVTIPAGRGGS